MKTSIITAVLSALVILALYFLVVPSDTGTKRGPSVPSSSSDDSALGNLK